MKRDGSRPLPVQNAASGQFHKRYRQKRSVNGPVDQDHRETGDRFLQQIAAVDQSVQPIRMRRKTDHDLRVQRTVPTRQQQRPNDSRQAQRGESGKQRGTDRDGSDNCSVGINAAAEQQCQKHRGPSRQRRGQQQKRQRSPSACVSEQK